MALPVNETAETLNNLLTQQRLSAALHINLDFILISRQMLSERIKIWLKFNVILHNDNFFIGIKL